MEKEHSFLSCSKFHMESHRALRQLFNCYHQGQDSTGCPPSPWDPLEHLWSQNIFYFILFLILKSLILTCVPKHEPPSQLPPHYISLGHPHAPAPSMLYPASDIDWRFNSYVIVYMLECHSPKSSHPLPLPLSPKVRYTHLCLFSCLAYRVVIAIFLNSIYMC